MKQYLAYTWKALKLPKKLQLFIMRFFNDSFLVGVTGVILNDKNEVLLLKHTYRQTEWSLPGGYLKKGEHPEAGIKREIFEETGFKVAIEKIIKTTHDRKDARLDVACFGKFISGKFVESAEVSEYGFFTVENLPVIGKKQKNLIEKTLAQEKGWSKKQAFLYRMLHLFR